MGENDKFWESFSHDFSHCLIYKLLSLLEAMIMFFYFNKEEKYCLRKCNSASESDWTVLIHIYSFYEGQLSTKVWLSVNAEVKLYEQKWSSKKFNLLCGFNIN